MSVSEEYRAFKFDLIKVFSETAIKIYTKHAIIFFKITDVFFVVCLFV